MLAVLSSARRPPLGVALLGLLIAALDGMLHLLPYIVFCSMIALSVWVPSSPSIDTKSFNMSADLRILIFLLALPVSSIGENILFRPARHLFLETVACWFEMRYVQPAHATGIWPDTWPPIVNALHSCGFVAGFLDGVMGEDSDLSSAHGKGVPAEDNQPSNPDSRLGRCEGLRTCPAEKKPSSSLRTAQHKGRRKRGHKHIVRFEPVAHENFLEVRPSRKTFISYPRVSPLSPWTANGPGVPSPITKSFSRIAGLLFHHRTPRKPIFIRHHFNFKATAHPARTPTNLGFYFSYHSRLWARSEDQDTRVSDNTSFCDPVQPVECVSEGLQPTFKPPRYLPWTREASAINLIPPEQQQCREFSQPSHMPQVPESTVRTYPPYTQQQPQPLVPTFPTAYEPLSQFTRGATTFPQHQHTDLNVPEQLMADPQPALPARDQYVQGVSQSRSLEDAPMPESSVPPCHCIPFVLDGPSAWPASRPQDASSSTLPQSVPFLQPVSKLVVSARPATNWISQQPPVSSTHFDVSQHVPLATAPYPCGPEPPSTHDTSLLNTNHAWQSVTVEHTPIQPFDQNIHPSSTLSVRSPAQPQEVIPQTFSPPEAPAAATQCDTRASGTGAAADTEMVANDDDDDDDESSSDSDYHPNSDADMDSESSYDSDSDSGDGDDDDDEGTATDTGNIYTQSSVVRTNSGKNKVPNPASGQNATSRDPSSLAPKDIKGKGKAKDTDDCFDDVPLLSDTVEIR